MHRSEFFFLTWPVQRYSHQLDKKFIRWANCTMIESLFHGLHQGSPTPGPWSGTGPQPIRNLAHSRRWAAGERAKVHLPTCRPPSLALLPEPSPLPAPSMEKLSSTKPVPGAKKVGDRWSIPEINTPVFISKQTGGPKKFYNARESFLNYILGNVQRVSVKP